MKSIYWGHFGITFFNDTIKVGEVTFQIGTQGPIEGYIGSPMRNNYEKMCIYWIEKGILPKTAK